MKNYQTKIFSIFGDSISTMEGCSVPAEAVFYEGMMRYQSGVYTQKESWWGQVLAGLGGRLLVNDSFSGSTVVKRAGYEIPSYGCSVERTSSLGKGNVVPQVIFVFMGTNDWGYGVKIYPSEGEENDLGVFSVAYGKMLENLRSNYPCAEIVCFTLPQCLEEHREQKGVFSPVGRSLGAYCEAIRACAFACGCEVVDLYSCCPPFETVDGFHPNAQGMKTIARAVLSALCGEEV